MTFYVKEQTEAMKQVQTNHNLLEARKRALENVVNGSIRPHGKLWGMDVFSWGNPHVELIASTIHSFPFPVIWLASSELLTAVVSFDAAVSGNAHAVISYADGALDENKFRDVPHVVTTNDVEAAFQKMNELRLKRGVILFCHSGTDAEHYENAFKAYLELHQI